MKSLEVMNGDAVAYEAQLPGEDSPRTPYFLVQDAASHKLELVTHTDSNSYVAALMPIGLDWVIMQRPGGLKILIGRTPVVALKVLHDNDAIHIGEMQLRYKSLDIQILATNSELIRAGRICPWCGVAFKANDQVIVCSGCRTPHHYGATNGHLDCWGMKRCGGSLPCDYKISRRGRAA